MTKIATATTLSPLTFSTGAMVLTRSGGAPGEVPSAVTPDVVEQLNYSFMNRPNVHISQCVGTRGWAGVQEAPLGSMVFSGGIGTFFQKGIMRIKIDPDTTRLRYGFECNFAGGESGTVEITIGASGALTLSFGAVDNGTLKTAFVNTSSTGTGWVTVTIRLRRDGGTLTTNEVRFVYIQDEEITTLPSPINE